MARITRECLFCGGVMRRMMRTVKITYKGQSAPLKQPGWWCSTCGEGVLEGSDNTVHDAALIRLKARVENVLAPKKIAAVRKRLGLSQRKAGELLGGGPRAFQKYESGVTLVSQPMSNLLRLLAHDPSRLKEIA